MSIHSSPYSNHEASSHFYRIVDANYELHETLALKEEARKMNLDECQSCRFQDGRHAYWCTPSLRAKNKPYDQERYREAFDWPEPPDSSA